MPRDGQRGPVLRQGLHERALSVMRIREAFDRSKVLGRALQNLLELVLRVSKLAELEKRAAEGHASGMIRGMNLETATSRVDGFLQFSRTAVLFGELRKRNRRRILLDPSSKAF